MTLTGRWNYRVVRTTVQDGDETFNSYAVHEAYYGEGGQLGWTEAPVAPVGESLEELRKELRQMEIALEYDIIDGDV